MADMDLGDESQERVVNPAVRALATQPTVSTNTKASSILKLFALSEIYFD